MKKMAFKFGALFLLALSFAACKKDYGNQLGPLQDSVASIPVSVTNQTYFERFPVVTAKVDTANGAANSTGKFSIVFSIPADKGKIKEITKVATGNGGVEYVQDPRYPNYLSAPVAGNGSNTITFNSDLNAMRDYITRLNAAFATLPGGATMAPPFNTSTGALGPLAPSSNAQFPNQIRFFFLLTLEDGRTLIPTEVDVRLI